MTEEYFRQQVHITTPDKDDESIINDYIKTSPDQGALASRFEVEREDGKAFLYILWSR